MLVGLGGSGKDVLLRVRRLFYERMGKNPDGSIGYPIVGYLVLDTDPGSPRFIEGDSPKDFVLKSIQLNTGGVREFVNCSMSDQEVARYFRGGATQYPHIFKWLRPEVEKYGAASAAVATGAGQNRQLARLAFFHHFAGTADRPGIRPTLERHLQQIMSQVRRPELLHRWRPKNAEVSGNELDVILVYSLAGGTGAGMFLDMGMLAREVVKGLGLEGLRAYFTHFAVLPEPFLAPPTKDRLGPELPPEERTKIQENAYAALREMEYFSRRIDKTFDLTIPPDVFAAEEEAAAGVFGTRGQTGTPWYQVQWEPRGKVFAIDSAPWDTCYLIGGGNDPLGDTLSPQDVYQMTAEFVFLDFDPNQFGTRRRMRRPNMQGRLADDATDEVRDERGTLYRHLVSRRYSTFGLSQIYFDRARMRRAASYRLAVSLLDHWARDLGLAPPTRKQYAHDDVIGGALLPGEKETPLALTFERVRDLLLLKDRKTDRQRTWLDDAFDDASKLREEVQNPGQGVQGEAAWVDELLARHDERLRRHPLGGKEGVTREGILQSAKALKEEVEARLRRLFLHRVQELGVPEAQKLFEEYYELLRPAIRTADQWTRAPVALRPVWRERVVEAGRLPNWLVLLRPADKAVQAELLRGIREVSKHLRNRYTFEASEEIRDCLQLASARIGRRDAGAAELRGSYHDLLKRFSDLQGRTRGYLEARFADLRKDDQGQKRTRGMLEHWDAETYDREVRAFLTQGGDARGYLQAVEARALAQLREQKGQEEAGKWESVDSLGQLILQVLPLHKATQAPEAFVEEFARDLANACWALLEGFCKDRSALELFNSEADSQQQTLEVLRKYSAPFLRRNSGVTQADGADTPSLVQLGIAESNSDAARRFRDKLAAGAREEEALGGLQAFSAQDDAIILCQEKHGLPLYYYQFLESMGRLYYHSAYQPERHFDFEFLQDRLPEVRKIDFEKQKHLGNCLELTLQGIMTGVLYWEKGQFWLSYSTSQYAPRVPYPQGGRLENMIHRYAENALERQELTKQVALWMQAARQSGDGCRLALLWCAVEDLVAEVSRRVEYLVRKSALAPNQALRQHPMVSILCSDHPDYKGLLLRLREGLGGLPNGSRWLRSKVDRHTITTEYSGNEQQALLAERERILEKCFQPGQPDRPPVRVIRPDAGLELAEAEWATELATREYKN
jgi:hypothetical protein